MKLLQPLFAAVIIVGIVAACMPHDPEAEMRFVVEVLDVSADVQQSEAENRLLPAEGQAAFPASVEEPGAATAGRPLTQIVGESIDFDEVGEVPTDLQQSLAKNRLLPTEGQEAFVENPPVATVVGQPLTRIVAESIDLDEAVVPVGWETIVKDGVTTKVWQVADFAAGWHKNSRLPGQGGNIVLTAHHNVKGQTFRYTVDLEPGDLITLSDERQAHNYQVVAKFIVKDKGEPEAVRRQNARWIGPFNEERLTLVTCWPFNSNTHRLIVIAKPVRRLQAVAR